MTQKSKHDVVSEFRTAEILTAARKVFAANGFNESTVDQIAAAARIAKGTIYLYYPSKKDIYLAALKQGIAELQTATRNAMQTAADIRAKLEAFVRTRLEYAEVNGDFIRIYHSEFGNLKYAAACDTEFETLYLQQAKALETVLQTAIDAREIRPLRADSAAFIIYDMVKGVMTKRLFRWSPSEVEEDIHLLNEMIWKGIVA